MSIFLSNNNIIPAIAASMVVAFVYLVFQSIFGKKEKSKNETIYDPSIPISLQTQLHIKDKQGFIERINYWRTKDNYKEALHLCTIYLNHHGSDRDIEQLSIIIKEQM